MESAQTFGPSSALTTAARVRAGELSAVDVVAAALERIERDSCAAVVHVASETALTDARAVDSSARALPLAGVPFVVKDNIDVAGQVTAAGSRAHDGRPATADALVVGRLRAAGAVLVGRANMDELAMGASTQTSAYGPTRNPVDPRRSPGGSSGGCAAAVAAGLVPLAVGTDTGGSVREPASQCGVVALAPSHGLLPMVGVTPFAPALDRVGPLAADAADVRVALEVMADHATTGSLPLRIGVVDELSGVRNRADVLAAFASWRERLGGRVVEVVPVSVPEAPHALGAYMSLTSVAALEWLDPWVASGRAGEEVLRRFEYGHRLVRYGRDQIHDAARVRDRLRTQVTAALASVDVLASPTMPTTAPLLFGPVSPEELADPLAAPYTDCWTVVANLVGVPALSMPCPVPPGAPPVGAMLMGRPGADGDVLALAEALGA